MILRNNANTNANKYILKLHIFCLFLVHVCVYVLNREGMLCVCVCVCVCVCARALDKE